MAFLLGVPREDLLRVGQLIGIKVIANEFVAYNSLTSEAQYVNMSPRSRLIATYALCGKSKSHTHTYILFSITCHSMNLSKILTCDVRLGFGNLGSLGTQIGVLSQIAPSRAGDVSRVALSALFSGVLSTLTSASIAGMLVTDQVTLAQESS